MCTANIGSVCSNEDKPFLVKVDGLFPYWFLQPPGQHTPIVKHYTKILSSNVEIVANYNKVQFVVDEAVCILQQYSKMRGIPIATQCNRLMKHVEALSVYLANFQSISTAIVPKLHYCMKCFYDYRPPREIEGKEQLLFIALVAKTVARVAMQNASFSKKAEDVMARIIETTRDHTEEPHPSIEALNQVVQCMSNFWQILSTHSSNLKDIALQINSVASLKIVLRDFEILKEQAIRFSAIWIALGKVCSIYFNTDELPYDLKNRAYNAVPASSADFNEFATSLDNHFQDIYSKLLSEDYHIQKEVVIYSTWIHPIVNTNGLECIQIAQEAMELIQQGNGKEADVVLIKTKHQSKGLLAVSHLIARRLENLQEYAKHQQELLMIEIDKLETEETKKVSEINDLEIKITKEQSKLSQYKQLQKKAEVIYKYALEMKRAAEEKVKKMSKWWWTPVKYQEFSINSFIQNWETEQVKANKLIVTEEAAKIDEYLGKQKEAENVSTDARKTKANLENEQAHLRSHIDKFKQQKDERFKMLLEMKKCTAYLIDTTFFWNEFAAAAEHGQNRTEKLQKLVMKANEKMNSAKILQSRGSKSFSKSFIDAWETINNMAQEIPQRDIIYNFKCAVCHIEQIGLPMPVDKMDVVCNTCAKQYI